MWTGFLNLTTRHSNKLHRLLKPNGEDELLTTCRFRLGGPLILFKAVGATTHHRCLDIRVEVNRGGRGDSLPQHICLCTKTSNGSFERVCVSLMWDPKVYLVALHRKPLHVVLKQPPQAATWMDICTAETCLFYPDRCAESLAQSRPCPKTKNNRLRGMLREGNSLFIRKGNE